MDNTLNILDDLTTLAARVLQLLRLSGNQLVCAESCTAGMISSTLAGIPGASQHLCGSVVVYRNAVKSAWLGVPCDVLDDPHRGAVCAETAEAMARGVLEMAPGATISLSITGHLGPDAPPELDGVIYVGWALRGHQELPTIRSRMAQLHPAFEPEQSDASPTLSDYNQICVHSDRYQLISSTPAGEMAIQQRRARQHEATRLALVQLIRVMQED